MRHSKRIYKSFYTKYIYLTALYDKATNPNHFKCNS